LPPQFLPAQARQVQQIIHQQAHLRCAVPNVLQVMLCLRGQQSREVLLQKIGERVNVPHRRSQVVRDRVGEGFQFLVGRA